MIDRKPKGSPLIRQYWLHGKADEYKTPKSLRECIEDEENRPDHPITWRTAITVGLVAFALIALLVFLAGCEILPSANQPASYGSGPMAIEYLQHHITATRGIVDINVAGFTRGAYRIWVQTRSRSQTNGPGSWFVPSGSITTVEVKFSRDKSGAPDTVTIMLENDFDEADQEYSRAVIEVSYQ